MGLAAGARVAVLAHNSDDYLELLYAIAWAGGVSVPLNTRWAVPENVGAIEDSGAAILFHRRALALLRSPVLKASMARR